MTAPSRSRATQLAGLASIGLAVAAAALARPSIPSPLLSSTIANADPVLLTSSGTAGHRWLIAGLHFPNYGHTVRLSLTNGGKRRHVLWSHTFADGYDPFMYPSWRRTYDGKPVLIFTYNLGAAWQKLTVVGIGRHGPAILQQIDAAAFDVISVTAADGNGDLRSMVHDDGDSAATTGRRPRPPSPSASATPSGASLCRPPPLSSPGSA